MMAEAQADHLEPALIAAWPPLRQAASLVGVSASSLSRRKDIISAPRGRDLRIRPSEVLRLARYYNRRPISKVASELLDFAYEHAPDYGPVVDAEIELTLGPSSPSLIDQERFLSEAQRALPAPLYAQIEEIYRRALKDGAQS